MIKGFTAYNFDWLSVTMPAAPNACITRHRSILAEAYMIPEPYVFYNGHEM
jgi:hypothetical protein